MAAPRSSLRDCGRSGPAAGARRRRGGRRCSRHPRPGWRRVEVGQDEAVVVHRKVDERDVNLVAEQRAGLIGPADPFDLDFGVLVRGVERPHQREQRLGILEKLTSGGGQLNVAARPGQRADTDVSLESANLPAEHRLGDEQALGRPAEMKFLRERREVAETSSAAARGARWSTDSRRSPDSSRPRVDAAMLARRASSAWLVPFGLHRWPGHGCCGSGGLEEQSSPE